MEKQHKLRLAGLVGAVLVLGGILGLGVWRNRNSSTALPPLKGLVQINETTWKIPASMKRAYLSNPQRVNQDIHLGPKMGSAPDSVTELRIAKVAPESPIYAAGFRKGDRIVMVNDQPVTTLSRAINLVHEVESCTYLTVKIEREGSILNYRFEFE